MGCETVQNTITKALATTPICILGSNKRRKAFIVGPIAGGIGGGQALTAAVFNPGTVQLWQVPPGVTQIVDAYVWGSGGESGASGGVLGGGGGGGGGFATSGPLAAVPGSAWTLNVDVQGGAALTDIINPSGTTVASAGSGANGLLDIGGGAGNATTGVIQRNGGKGGNATGDGGAGSGGGGAAGNNANGSGGAHPAGGAGGGVATLLGYGVGGAGGAGGALTFAGSPGNAPGGGGGGPATGVAGVSGGGAGLAVIFYQQSLAQQAISMSHRSDVVVGGGIIQFLPGLTYPVLVRDRDIGSIIKDEWYIISGVAGVLCQITEYMSEEDYEDE